MRYHRCDHAYACNVSLAGLWWITSSYSTTSNIAEKAALQNRFVARFEIIDKIKAEFEKQCPSKVSCVDIIALASRDVVSYEVSFLTF